MDQQEAIRRSFLRTFSGVNVFPLDINPDDINIVDIAHALSNQCRFSGHTEDFYSVAQHCVLGAKEMLMMFDNKDLALAFLLHDASEYVLVDMPTPVKRLMPEYGAAEARVMRAIEKRFGLKYSLDNVLVRKVDMVMLATEARDLMGNPQDWVSLDGLVSLQDEIIPWGPHRAKKMFLKTYKELT